jgi:glycerol-3-phosphate O-acyltransferase
VLKFILTKMWLRMRGRFLRFGSAGVVFGTPVSMQAFGVERPVEELAVTLMTRIQDAMPHMCVPLLSELLLDRDAPVPRERLLTDAAERVRAAPERFLMRESEPITPRLERALEHMLQRGFVQKKQDKIAIRPEERDALRYYANSISGATTTFSAAAQ